MCVQVRGADMAFIFRWAMNVRAKLAKRPGASS